MKTINLHPIPLTRANFSPFGDVIQSKDAKHFAINDGNIERYDDLAKIMLGNTSDTGDNARASINIFKANKDIKTPAAINLVERHPYGSQAFIPLNNQSTLIVVAPAGETVNPADLVAFITTGNQGVNYHSNTWHMPLMAAEVGQSWLVVDRKGDGDNCDLWHFKDVNITLHNK